MRRISGTDTGDSSKNTENKKNIPNKTECSFLKSARYNGCPGDSEDPGLINYSDGK